MPRTIIGGANREVRFTIYTERQDRFFRAAGGEVDRETEKRAKEVLKASAKHIGKTYSGDQGGTKLRNSGSIVRASQQGNWQVVFKHRAAEVHYAGIKEPYLMPIGGGKKSGRPFYRETGKGPTSPYRGNVKGQLRGRKRRGKFGPTKGPIHRKPVPGNPFIQTAARELGLIVSDKPILDKGGERAPGVVRIPRGFA